MKKLTRNFYIGLAVVFLLFLIGVIVNREMEIPKNGKEGPEYLTVSKSPKIEGIDIESIIEYGEHYSLGVHYPVTKQDEINSKITEFVQSHIANFKSDVTLLFEGPVPPGGYPSWKYELNIDYDVHRYCKEIISFKFNIISYTGGAHTIRDIKTMTFNLESGKVVDLNDTFKEDSNYIDIISQKSAEQLIESGRLGNMLNEEWVRDGTAPKEENFKHFALTDNSIIFYFPHYQVAPWIAGEQYVDIMYEELLTILNPDFINIPKESDNDGIPIPEKPNVPEQPIGIEKPEAPIIDKDDSLLVAITFDDGPHPSYTNTILDELKKRNAVATFFVLGNRAQYYPEILQRIISEGSEIGNHTWSHKQLTLLTPEDIKKQINDTQRVIKSSTGIAPTIMRPPYGSINKNVRQQVNMPIILWSVDPEDWKYKDRDIIVGHILTHTKDGDITLQHDLYKTTVESVGPILDELIARGYKFVTVSQLLDFNKDSSKPITGEVYSKRK